MASGRGRPLATAVAARSGAPRRPQRGGRWLDPDLRVQRTLIDSLRRALAGRGPGAPAALVAGMESERHAAEQGVSLDTVRSQIAALVMKMDCTRHSDLVREAARFL